ncbi:MAG: hypothetical protein KDC44_03810, partial [Phaeodactylibacter sp.]|nr:hypothetical protein [Phaeodactylibacter sp.]
MKWINISRPGILIPALLLFVGLPLCLPGQDKKETKEDLVITERYQTLTFELTKEQELIAVLKSKEIAVSQSSKPVKFSKAIFFDENSSVTEVTRLDKNRYRPIPAIISDYESDGIFHSDIKLHLIEYVLREEGQSVEIHYQK